ncbi:MAG: asparagine synthase-related protein [Desulfobacterales bacterium]|jgi:hypothetical protein|nr:asparagine synthase-related protein [Desulfobacterales bacterium]MDP6806626.1 asparagine synthase-related protein [Desulfobacterales bacterium]|tara:strand:+ start:35227 stop:35376 length:150 start_codon:yes stop_codon:yes gene_type:complete
MSVPLLDHRIVEYIATVSEKLKYKQGIGKILLQKLLWALPVRQMWQNRW